jgi:hypothetical protein
MVAKRFIIGIDGGTKTGVAVWDVSGRLFQHVKTIDFWEAYHWICEVFKPAETVIYIEDPSKNPPVWKRPGMKDHEYYKKCQHVGAVKRESLLMMKGLERQEFEVKAIRPQKGSFTKMKSAAFKHVTKYKGRTSEHSRDAAMLVFQRSH